MILNDGNNTRLRAAMVLNNRKNCRQGCDTRVKAMSSGYKDGSNDIDEQRSLQTPGECANEKKRNPIVFVGYLLEAYSNIFVKHSIIDT